ncbi:hypothetical protein DIPPA_65915, partial [Diplonema papillatum]
MASRLVLWPLVVVLCVTAQDFGPDGCARSIVSKLPQYLAWRLGKGASCSTTKLLQGFHLARHDCGGTQMRFKQYCIEPLSSVETCSSH